MLTFYDTRVDQAIAEGGESTVTAEEMATLAAFAVERELPAGGRVFALGEPGDSMFVVLAGEVELQLGDAERHKRLGTGSFFGELGLLGVGQGRSGTARATPGTRLLEITRDAFEKLVAGAPALAVALLARSARTLLAGERLLTSQLAARNRELEQALDFLRRTREELSAAELAAATDPLTGLYNRRCLDRLVPLLLARAQQSGLGVALLLLDLDDFKGINDRHGHGVGDEVLRAFAGRLRAAVRWSDVPCRLGGDEFLALLGDIPSAEVGRQRAEEVQRAVGHGVVEAEGRRIPVACSIGGTPWRGGESLAAVTARADQALYAAKGRGRGVVVWEDETLLPSRDAHGP